MWLIKVLQGLFLAIVYRFYPSTKLLAKLAKLEKETEVYERDWDRKKALKKLKKDISRALFQVPISTVSFWKDEVPVKEANRLITKYEKLGWRIEMEEEHYTSGGKRATLTFKADNIE